MPKQFVVKQEHAKKRGSKPKPSNGVLIIPSINKQRRRQHKFVQSANVRVIATLDIKSTRMQILSNWKSYTPRKIVAIFRKHYHNIRTLSVMLSRFKKQLYQLANPPPPRYLEGVKLSRNEYNEIRKEAPAVRAKGSMNVVVISNADAIVEQAFHYICSSDPNLCYSGLLICSGLRPIGILKVAKFSTKLNNNQGDKQAWFACQTRFAKRGNMKSKYKQATRNNTNTDH